MTKHNSSSVNGNQKLCTPSGNSKWYRVCFWSFPKNLVIKNDRSVSYYNEFIIKATHSVLSTVSN